MAEAITILAAMVIALATYLAMNRTRRGALRRGTQDVDIKSETDAHIRSSLTAVRADLALARGDLVATRRELAAIRADLQRTLEAHDKLGAEIARLANLVLPPEV